MINRLLIYFVLVFLMTAIQMQTATSSCGKLLNSLMKYDPVSKKASFEKFFFTEEEFCDLGTNEINANFEISLFDKNNRLLNTKFIFLNTDGINELLKPKTNTFLKNKIVLSSQFRNIKFSILVGPEQIASYKVYSKETHKLYGEGIVK